MTTWSPSDKTPSMVLSDGNLRATATGSGAWVRCTTPRSSGRIMASVAFGGAVSGPRIGLATEGDPGSYMGANANAVGLFPNGAIGYAGGFPYAASSYGLGDVIDLAVDLDTRRIWFRTNGGPWNGSASANPAQGQGGHDISGLLGPLFVMVQSGAGGEFVANFGGSAFGHPLPEGFSAWREGAASPLPPAPRTRTLVLTEGTSWIVPSDWAPGESTVHCYGAGVDGAAGAGVGRHATGGRGGGAGAYARRSGIALVPGAAVSYRIGDRHPIHAGATWFLSPDTVRASGATEGAGGRASACVGDRCFDGGDGGAAGSASGGGGGAAGPLGPGAAGGSGASSGGAANGGALSGGSGQGGAGSAGQDFADEQGARVGAGSGGAGRDSNGAGGAGGRYGAGGGGGRSRSGAGGQGAPGLIVIEYGDTEHDDTGEEPRARVEIGAIRWRANLAGAA